MKTKKEEERMNLRQKEKVSIATTSLRGAALSLLGFQKSVLGIAHTHTRRERKKYRKEKQAKEGEWRNN